MWRLPNMASSLLLPVMSTEYTPGKKPSPWSPACKTAYSADIPPCPMPALRSHMLLHALGPELLIHPILLAFRCCHNHTPPDSTQTYLTRLRSSTIAGISFTVAFVQECIAPSKHPCLPRPPAKFIFLSLESQLNTLGVRNSVHESVESYTGALQKFNAAQRRGDVASLLPIYRDPTC